MADKTAREQIGVDLPEPQSVEQAPVEVEQGVEEAARPEWLPEKFKDESEFANSYRELEEELRQRGKRENEMQAHLDQLTSVVESIGNQGQTQGQQQGGNEYFEQLSNAYENDPLGTMVFLSQQAAAQAVQNYQAQQAPAAQQQQIMAGELMATNAERVLEAKYSDWDTYGPRVGDLLERNPHLISAETLSSLDRTTEVLEAVYKQVKYDDLATELQNATSDTSRMKMQAQTVSGGAGRPGQPSPDEEKINRIVAAAKNTSYSAFRGGA